MSAASFVETLAPIPTQTRWRASDLTSIDELKICVDFDDLVERCEAVTATGREPQSISASDLPLGTAEPGVSQLLHVLRTGRGFALVDGFPVTEVAPQTVELLFWRIGLALGDPVSQSVMGERLGHVVDKTDVDPNARAYRRNERLTPHSDPADYLSFLCLKPAASGGRNHFVSALEIHETLRRNEPALLERLYRGYYYSRFGEQADDEEPITPYRMPIFSNCDGLVSSFLVRQYIEIAASEDRSIRLDDVDRRALDAVDALASDREIALDFTLAKGQAVFANNFTTLHARTGFTDPPGMAKRHLLRLWLDGRPRRQVLPEMRLHQRGPGVPPQPGRTPTYQTEVEIL